MDHNHNGKLERNEMLENFRRLEVYEKMKLKALFIAMPTEEKETKLKQYAEEVKAGVNWFMEWYDQNKDQHITLEEFV